MESLATQRPGATFPDLMRTLESALEQDLQHLVLRAQLLEQMHEAWLRIPTFQRQHLAHIERELAVQSRAAGDLVVQAHRCAWLRIPHRRLPGIGLHIDTARA